MNLAEHLNSWRSGLWPLGGLCSNTRVPTKELCRIHEAPAPAAPICPGPGEGLQGILQALLLSPLLLQSQQSRGNTSAGYYKPLTQAPIEAGYCSKMILYGLKGIKKKSTSESILINTSLKAPESHTAPVYVNPKDKGIFNFSRTINKPVKLIHLRGIIK